ncbi:MAG: hypothetical protein K6A63_04765 [Acholeplasmatales bacterium]|nr:hypothetical protein [Acholeplasmatales bacterium]
MAKTSLERSHSKASNFKLTMICFILALGIAAVWGGLALVNTDYQTLGIIVAACGGAVALLFFILIGKFTR